MKILKHSILFLLVIAIGIPVNIAKANPNDDLSNGIMEGNLQLVKDALESGANINAPDKNGVTALMWSAFEDQIAILKFLLKAGADVNAKDIKEETALIWAASDGYDEILEILLENGADVNAESQYEETALMRAAINGHYKCVELLIDGGADINKNPVGKKYEMTSKNNRAVGMNQVLSTAFGALDGSQLEARPALILAASKGHKDIVRLLIKDGADVNIKSNYDHDTALIAAAKNGHASIIKVLLKNGAITKMKNARPRLTVFWFGYGGETALTAAAFYGYVEAVKALIDEGVDVDQFNESGETALMIASRQCHPDVVELLLANKAKVNLQVGGLKHNRTALIIAAIHGCTECVKVLLKKGADKNIKEKAHTKFFTALSYAESRGHTEIVKLLQGADLGSKPSYFEELEILDPACEETTTCDGTYLEEKVIKYKYSHEDESREVSVVDVNEDKIPEMKVTRTGIVTDGITRLVLRVKTNQAVKFVLKPPQNMKSDRSSKYPWGALSEYDRQKQHPESIEIEHTKKYYTYALYRSPANFPLKSLKKPVYITIEATAKKTGEKLEKKIQLLPPPVVLIHGVWSSKRKWKERREEVLSPPSNLYIDNSFIRVVQSQKEFNLPYSFQDILTNIGFQVYLVNYRLKEVATPTFNPQSASYSIGQLIAETNGVLNNYRNKNIAITQTDVVGHSMGGLITRARTVYKHEKFKKLANYKRGDFHKIITIGTPHQGSPIANVLVECEDATGINCEVTYRERDAECFKRCRYSCQTLSCESECQKGCMESEVSCARDGWLELNEVAEWDFYYLNPFTFRVGKKDPMPIGEAVYDLQEGSDAIRQIPKTRIPSHAIVGRKPKMNSADEMLSNIPFVWFHIFFKSDRSLVTINELLGSSEYHDTIVAEESQKGGLSKDRVTIVENVIHTDEPLSFEVRQNTVRLLLDEEIKFDDKNLLLPIETETFGFFKHCDKKLKQWTTCDELPKTIKKEPFESKASVSVEPLSGTVVKPGEKIQVKFDITDGTVQQAAVFNVNGNLIHLKGTPPYQMEFDVPAGKAGRVNINGITLGDSEESYSFQSYVVIMPEGKPLSISSLKNKIVLDQVGATYQLQIIGKYPDGSEYDISAGKLGTTYTTQSGNDDVVTVSPDGLIEAKGNGQESVFATNQGQTVKVMINIGKASVSEPVTQ